MNKTLNLAMLPLIISMAITVVPTGYMASVETASSRAEIPKGPRSNLDILFYGSQEVAYWDLKLGIIDFIKESLTHGQFLDAQADPNLCVARYSENGMVEFDLNNNYTIATYPGVRNPLNVKEFRRALSCAVDKSHITHFILNEMAEMLNVPIPWNSLSWWPDCAFPENYPWDYNMTEAENQLALAGFVDTNDPGLIRNYPANWPGAEDGRDMDPLIFYVRTEDKRLDAGRYLADQLTLLGIPYNKIEATSDVCSAAVMDARNYHIYTGGWSLGRYPLHLYNIYHSDFWFPGGANYVTGMNESNLPNYPDYDELAYHVYYTESLEASRTAAKAAAALGWCNEVFNIPLWSYNSYVAWRKTMPGVVNMFGNGLDNPYLFINAYKTTVGPIRMGTIAAPEALNPLYSIGYSDYAVLDRVFESLMQVNPYDLAIDQPGAAQDWEVGTWTDPNPGPGEPARKTNLTCYLRTDADIVSPSTGTKTGNLDAEDMVFSTWYTYAFDDGSNWINYRDVHHTRMVDDYTIEFCFDSASYWFYTAPQYPIFAEDEIGDKVTAPGFVSFDGPLSAGTQFKLATTDQIVQVTSAGGLVEGVDFIIFGGYEDYEHNWIWILNDLPAGTYTINYKTPDVDPHGYYLAGLDWTETWYGFGQFYPIAITPGVGGYASFNKNLHYWLSTPPLSETDWIWVWYTPGGVPGPWIPGRDDGYFEITIYDVVRATASYCQRGDGPYNPRYFPGADLDETDLGHVGIYDVVNIIANYGLKWGSPPPNPPP